MPGSDHVCWDLYSALDQLVNDHITKYKSNWCTVKKGERLWSRNLESNIPELKNDSYRSCNIADTWVWFDISTVSGENKPAARRGYKMFRLLHHGVCSLH